MILATTAAVAVDLTAAALAVAFATVRLGAVAVTRLAVVRLGMGRRGVGRRALARSAVARRVLRLQLLRLLRAVTTGRRRTGSRGRSRCRGSRGRGHGACAHAVAVRHVRRNCGSRDVDGVLTAVTGLWQTSIFSWPLPKSPPSASVLVDVVWLVVLVDKIVDVVLEVVFPLSSKSFPSDSDSDPWSSADCPSRSPVVVVWVEVVWGLGRARGRLALGRAGRDLREADACSGGERKPHERADEGTAGHASQSFAHLESLRGVEGWGLRLVSRHRRPKLAARSLRRGTPAWPEARTGWWPGYSRRMLEADDRNVRAGVV